MEAKDKDVIKVLLKIGRLFGLYPLEKPSCLGVFYQIFMLCFTFAVSVFSMYNIVKMSYNSISTLHIFIDGLASSFVIIQGCCIQITSVLYPTVWIKILKELNLVNADKKHKKSVVFEILFLHLLFVARIAFSAIVWTQVTGWWLYKYYIFRIVHEYYAFNTLLLMVHVNRVVKIRFRAINEILYTTQKLFVEKFDLQLQVRHVETVYKELLLLLDNLNSVFGYTILFIMANTVIVVLKSFCYVLKNFDFDSIDDILVTAWNATASLFVLVFRNQIRF